MDGRQRERGKNERTKKSNEGELERERNTCFFRARGKGERAYECLLFCLFSEGKGQNARRVGVWGVAVGTLCEVKWGSRAGLGQFRLRTEDLHSRARSLGTTPWQ